jgi:hypothetical protein
MAISMANEPYREWRLAQDAVTAFDLQLISQHELVGVGVGFKTIGGSRTGQISVKAFVPRKLPRASIAPDRIVPETISVATAKVPTDVDEMATATAPPTSYGRTVQRELFQVISPARRWPLNGGDSISHFLAPLGTVGVAVRDPFRPRQLLVLSCNHVLAELNHARLGDPVLQPASWDGGRVPFDVCGTLDRFVPIHFGLSGINRVDAAIARVRSAEQTIDWIGPLAGVRSPNDVLFGERVFKVGSSSGLTKGNVEAVNFTGWIPYPGILGGGTALFRDQIVTTPMAAFGDSGAVLCDANANAVGLLFAGSTTHTFYNSFVHALHELAVTL